MPGRQWLALVSLEFGEKVAGTMRPCFVLPKVVFPSKFPHNLLGLKFPMFPVLYRALIAEDFQKIIF